MDTFRKPPLAHAMKRDSICCGVWFGAAMLKCQPGIWDAEHRLRELSEQGDLLEKLSATVDFEMFCVNLVSALGPLDEAKGGRASMPD